MPWKPEYDKRRSTGALKVRLAPDADAALRDRARANGVSASRYIELLLASGGAPAQRLHGLGIVGTATAATNAIADELHALRGEVMKANGSVRSLFLDAPERAYKNELALDAAAVALRETAGRVDTELARLSEHIGRTLAALERAAREVRA